MTHRSIKSDLLVIIGSLNFLEKGSLGEKYRLSLQNKARCEKKGGNRENGRNREGPLQTGTPLAKYGGLSGMLLDPWLLSFGWVDDTKQ